MNLKTIAKMAGVSTVTVSNVINGKHNKASKETIQRVQKIIEETGYRPSATARSLIMKRSRIIAVVIPNLRGDEAFSASPYNTQILGCLERCIRSRGYYMMLRCVMRSFEVLSDLAAWNIDGAFLLGVAAEDARKLQKMMGIPAVFIDTYTTEDDSLAAVSIEDRKGGYLAAKYLLDKGHRRIAFVSPPTSYPGVMQERYRGFCGAYREMGLTPPPGHLVETRSVFYEQGLAAGKRMASLPLRHTAAVTAADMLAFGLMEGLRLGGCRVPEDVSVVGFDDLPACQYTYPRLTSISQHLEEKARCASECLFTMLRDNTAAACRRKVDVELVERQSVAALPPDRP